MQHSRNEMMRLKSELTNALAQVDEGNTYKKNMEMLDASVAHLTKDLQEMTSEKEATHAQMMALREELEKARAEEVTQVRAELQAQHLIEVENLKNAISVGKTDSAETEEMKTVMFKMEAEKKALADKMEELEEAMVKVEGEKEQMKSHVAKMEEGMDILVRVQGEKEALAAQVEKSVGVRQSLDERVATLSKQLEAETASKKVRQLLLFSSSVIFSFLFLMLRS